MKRIKLLNKYPDIHRELEFKDIIYQRHIHQHKLPYTLSWLSDGRQPYRSIEMSIWGYVEDEIINHKQAIRTFFALMMGYYGFELPDEEEHSETFDLLKEVVGSNGS